MVKQLEDYITRGWAIFPIQAGTKIPATPHGFYDATTDPATITTWLTSSPGTSWAVATGRLSQLIVVDVDVKRNGLENVKKLNLPDTYTVHTPSGGMHLYYQIYGSQELTNRTNLIPGVDIRAEGGYVVVPPSPGYDLDPGFRDGITWVPNSLLVLLHRPKPTLETTQTKDGLISEGGRTDYLIRMAGALKRKGLGTNALTAALQEENLERCTPPLSDYEVVNIVKSSLKWNSEDPILAREVPESIVVRPSELIAETLAYLGDKETVKGEPTGLVGLDKLLGGGKRLGEITCWHAEAKVGKNALWHKLMYEFSCMRNIPIGYASRELTPETEVIPNLLSLSFKENAWLSELTPDKMAQYGAMIDTWPIYFAKGYGYFPFEEMVKWVEELMNYGVKYFWFDHLHQMVEDFEDYHAATKLIKDIKTLCKTHDIHVDIIIQPSKLMDGQKLGLNSIRGGSAMGQAIDTLLTLERLPEGDNLSRLSLKAGRSRLCSLGSIVLRYDKETTDFIEQQSYSEPSMVKKLG